MAPCYLKSRISSPVLPPHVSCTDEFTSGVQLLKYPVPSQKAFCFHPGSWSQLCYKENVLSLLAKVTCHKVTTYGHFLRYNQYTVLEGKRFLGKSNTVGKKQHRPWENLSLFRLSIFCVPQPMILSAPHSLYSKLQVN